MIGWTNTPNAKGYYKRKEFEYDIVNNSHGMRDNELMIDKRKKNIAVIGDSYVWGIGASYVKDLQKY